MSKPTILGKMMARINRERQELQRNGRMGILKRNNIQVADPGTNGYLLQEDVRILSDGTESTRYRLYKLVDEETVQISVEIKTKVMESKSNGYEKADRGDEAAAI